MVKMWGSRKGGSILGGVSGYQEVDDVREGWFHSRGDEKWRYGRKLRQNGSV